MLHVMSAMALQNRVPGLSFSGFTVAHWNLASGRKRNNRFPLPRITQHDTPIGPLTDHLASSDFGRYVLRCMLLDCEIFPDVSTMRRVFPPLCAADISAGPGQIMLNVRGAEVLKARSPEYGPIPVAFYEQVLDETGLEPIFMGQLGNDYYSTLLRRRFPKAKFVPSAGAAMDFERMRQSKNLAISLSTFSWVAGWLSQAHCIHLPLLGSFNPEQRPDIWMIPTRDPRYRFYQFPIRRWQASQQQIDDLSQPVEIQRLDQHSLGKLRVVAADIRKPQRADSVPAIARKVARLTSTKRFWQTVYGVPKDAILGLDQLLTASGGDLN